MKTSEDAILAELARVYGDFEGFNELIFGRPYPDKPAVSPAQARFTKKSMKAKYGILTCGNSWGKTECLARKHTYLNIFKIGFLLDPMALAMSDYYTLNCSYEYSISEKVFWRIEALRRTSEVMKYLITKVDKQKLNIDFRCGAQFQAGSTKENGKHIEGERYAYVSVEEAGYEQNLEYLRNNVLMPRTLCPQMGDDGGWIDFVGTPKHFSDPEYYAMFLYGQDPKNSEYYSQEGSTYENIFLSRAQIEKIESSITDDNARQRVIYGKFVTEAGAPFDYDLVFSIFSDALEREARREKFKYFASWDLARINDKTVGYVWDISELPFKRIVNRFEMRGNDWSDIFDLIQRTHYEYQCDFCAVDSTGMGGDMAVSELANRGIPVHGICFTKKKEAILEALRVELARTITTPSRWIPYFGRQTKGTIKSFMVDSLRDQLVRYRWDDKRLETDDVMALAVGNYYLGRQFVVDYEAIDVVAAMMNR